MEQEFPDLVHETSRVAVSNVKLSKMVGDMFKIVDSAYGKVTTAVVVHVK